MTKDQRPLRPARLCLCGCKTEIGDSSYFARGHDKLAEAAYLALKHDGTVARLLADNGYNETNSVIEAALADPAAGWERCPVCQHPGNPQTMRYHAKMHARSGRTELKET